MQRYEKYPTWQNKTATFCKKKRVPQNLWDTLLQLSAASLRQAPHPLPPCNKKAEAFASAFYYSVEFDYMALTCFMSLDFRLEALFLWMTERLASLSMMETILGSLSAATFLSSSARKSRSALRMVLA